MIRSCLSDKKIHVERIEFQKQKEKALAYPTKSRSVQEKFAKEILENSKKKKPNTKGMGWRKIEKWNRRIKKKKAIHKAINDLLFNHP